MKTAKKTQPAMAIKPIKLEDLQDGILKHLGGSTYEGPLNEEVDALTKRREQLEDQMKILDRDEGVVRTKLQKIFAALTAPALLASIAAQPYDAPLREMLGRLKPTKDGYDKSGRYQRNMPRDGVVAWKILKKDGATDEQIKSNLKALTSEYPYEAKSKGFSIDGGALYEGEKFKGTRKQVLKLDRLAAEVRRVYQIPQPIKKATPAKPKAASKPAAAAKPKAKKPAAAKRAKKVEIPPLAKPVEMKAYGSIDEVPWHHDTDKPDGAALEQSMEKIVIRPASPGAKAPVRAEVEVPYRLADDRMYAVIGARHWTKGDRSCVSYTLRRVMPIDEYAGKTYLKFDALPLYETAAPENVPLEGLIVDSDDGESWVVAGEKEQLWVDVLGAKVATPAATVPSKVDYKTWSRQFHESIMRAGKVITLDSALTKQKKACYEEGMTAADAAAKMIDQIFGKGSGAIAAASTSKPEAPVSVPKSPNQKQGFGQWAHNVRQAIVSGRLKRGGQTNAPEPEVKAEPPWIERYNRGLKPADAANEYFAAEYIGGIAQQQQQQRPADDADDDDDAYAPASSRNGRNGHGTEAEDEDLAPLGRQ